MKNIKYLIIGGGMAGTTAAETIRQKDKEGSIAIVSDEPYRFYSRIMISKDGFPLGKVSEEKIWLKKEEWYTENNISLMVGKRAVSLDAKNKIVDLDDDTQIQYEKLLLAIGGHARKLQIPGSDKKGVLYLRTLDHAREVIENFKTAKKGIVIGGGFVSFEICEAMSNAGIDTTVMIRRGRFWENLFDETGGKIIEKAIEDRGIEIMRNTEVGEITGSDNVSGVVTSDGAELACDVVVVSIGAKCSNAWLGKAGIEVNRGIITNEMLETNLPDIWSAGDSAEFKNESLGENVMLGNWANAFNQGRAVALNMMGEKNKFHSVSSCGDSILGLSINVVGNLKISPDRQVIVRNPKDDNSYGQIIIKNGKMVGAALINMTKESPIIAQIIQKEIDVSDKIKNLEDVEFDLKRLLH